MFQKEFGRFMKSLRLFERTAAVSGNEKGEVRMS
jgi:hypothetical protein